MTNSTSSAYCFLAFDAHGKHRDSLLAALRRILPDYGLQLKTYQTNVDSLDSTLEKVRHLVAKAACVVADAGCDAELGLNANVAFELGLAVAIGRPCLIICSTALSLPTNLRGQDVLEFPNCLTIGDAENDRLREFFANLCTTLLGGKSIRIFSSRSNAYLDLLAELNRLPGREIYVGPELRAFFRPPSLERRWLLEVRRCGDSELEAQMIRRSSRREAWRENLSQYGCTDIYPMSALEFTSWRKSGVTPDEHVGFIERLLATVEEFPNYSLVLLNDMTTEKYWMKLGPAGSFVVFEGWEYVEVREDRPMGGLIMADVQVVNAFEEDAQRLRAGASLNRAATIAHLKNLLNLSHT